MPLDLLAQLRSRPLPIGPTIVMAIRAYLGLPEEAAPFPLRRKSRKPKPIVGNPNPFPGYIVYETDMIGSAAPDKPNKPKSHAKTTQLTF